MVSLVLELVRTETLQSLGTTNTTWRRRTASMFSFSKHIYDKNIVIVNKVKCLIIIFEDNRMQILNLISIILFQSR